MSKARREKRKFKIEFMKDGKFKTKLPGRKCWAELRKSLEAGEIGSHSGFKFIEERERHE